MNGDKVVLTTGANSGIGLATAIAVARRGFRSVGTVRSEEKAALACRAAREAGVEIQTALLDVTDASACSDVIDKFQPFAVVNSAGLPCSGAIEEVREEEVRQAFETLVLGPVRLARLSLPIMRERQEGRIVFVSSAAGRISAPLSGWYYGAKHALESVADALRMEVSRDDVGVTLVEPGVCNTPMLNTIHDQLERIPHGRYDESHALVRSAMTKWERFATGPDVVANTIVQALTRSKCKARYTVGKDVRVEILLDSLLPTSVKDWLWCNAFGLNAGSLINRSLPSSRRTFMNPLGSRSQTPLR